jgi:hypothetical protein
VKVENWVTFNIILFSVTIISQSFFLVPLSQPIQQLPDFPDVYWFFEGKPLAYQARDLVVIFLPDNNKASY